MWRVKRATRWHRDGRFSEFAAKKRHREYQREKWVPVPRKWYLAQPDQPTRGPLGEFGSYQWPTDARSRARQQCEILYGEVGLFPLLGFAAYTSIPPRLQRRGTYSVTFA